MEQILNVVENTFVLYFQYLSNAKKIKKMDLN